MCERFHCAIGIAAGTVARVRTGTAGADPELPHLVALQPAVEPARFVLDDAECTLGRGVICNLVVPFAFVSRVHSRIRLESGRFQLHDRQSSNGTFVNGERIQGPHILANHDLIGLGEAGPHLTYVDPDPAQNAATCLAYDDGAMRFSLGSTRLDLTPNQFRLLRRLNRNRGEVCSRDECAEAVNNLIVTRPGLGYVLDDAA